MSAVCDPVMGDEGKLYVAPELVQAYKERIMPLASVLVPNQVRFSIVLPFLRTSFFERIFLSTTSFLCYVHQCFCIPNGTNADFMTEALGLSMFVLLCNMLYVSF